jgi:outer membrane protein assembly factor BamB
MDSEDLSPSPPEATPASAARPSRWPLVRLVAAVVLTPVVLIYSWGFVLIIGMLERRLMYERLSVLVVGAAVMISLTAGLSRRLTPRAAKIAIWLVVTLWTTAGATLMALYAGELISRPLVVVLFVSGTYWLLCVAWLLYFPVNWARRMTALAILLSLAVPFPLLLKPAGLTGDSRVNFVWRWKSPPEAGRALAVARDDDSSPGADVSHAAATDYPQFLGPLRTGVVEGVPLAGDWRARPPREIWRRPIGEGWSAFAVVGDYCVTHDQLAGDERIVCLKVSDGTPVWAHSYPARFDANSGGSNLGGTGPRATPTIHDGRVYALGATGILHCLEGATGKPVWSADILKDNGGAAIHHGVCGSPLIAGDLVIVAPTGNTQACLAAYDRKTGTKVWRTGRHEASYGSPALATLAGRAQLLLYTNEGIDAHDAETGDFLWAYTWTNHVRVNCSQPLILDEDQGRLLLCTGYNAGSVFLEARPGAAGWSVTELRRSEREMKTKFTTAVRLGDHVYGLDDGILACMNLEGKRLWKAGRYQHGQVLLSGNLLIVQAENGEVVLVEPNPRELLERGRITALSGKTWNNPALAGLYLLVRNDHEAACYELPAADD